MARAGEAGDGSAVCEVAMFPDYRTTNPYQGLLADGLSANGCRVRFPPVASRALPLTTACRGRAVDVVHVHWLDAYLRSRSRIGAVAKALRCIADLAVLRATGRRVVWTAHNVVSHEARHPRLETFLLGLIVRLPDVLLVHGPAAREEIARAYRLGARARRRLHVVAHGNYDGCYPASADRGRARSALGIAADETCVLSFGAVRRYKDVPGLIRRFRSAAGPATRLVVAGRAQPVEIGLALTAATAGDPRVVVHDRFIPDDEVAAYLLACDALLLSYERTLTSGTACLAQTFGRAVLAPDVPTLRDALEDDGTVWIRGSSAEALRSALDELSARGPARLGEASRHAADRRDWRVLAGAVADLYRGR